MIIKRVVIVLQITAVLLPSTVLTAEAVTVPCGFKAIVSDTGVKVYKKDYASGISEYVTVVNLNSGEISNLTGALVNAPDGEIDRKSMNDFWNDAAKQNTSTRNARVVVNGTFFKQKNTPTSIAFGLKVAGKTITYGYGIDEFPNLISTFSFNSLGKTASIQPYNKLTFDTSTPDVVGALDPTANKSADKYLPRTFVGVRDDDGNNYMETVIIYSSASARQVDASNVLKNFGASSIAMLDGGGSTGLIIDGKTYINAGRTVPQAIAVYAGRHI
ncbi:MAG: phosphodiester glycosidase family protein [Aphanothece sp. CMT-3BRIN-NPC111]|jgi:hypothetical protein|nr:phosphodiester glycosidase family protein [Aphanothece sp. CMT-3BRIN-NPC111]